MFWVTFFQNEFLKSHNIIPLSFRPSYLLVPFFLLVFLSITVGQNKVSKQIKIQWWLLFFSERNERFSVYYLGPWSYHFPSCVPQIELLKMNLKMMRHNFLHLMQNSKLYPVHHLILETNQQHWIWSNQILLIANNPPY